MLHIPGGTGCSSSPDQQKPPHVQRDDFEAKFWLDLSA